MNKPTFIDTVTHIPAEWANILSDLVFDVFGQARNTSAAIHALGVGTLGLQNADEALITGGAIDNTPVGMSVPMQGRFTVLSALVDPVSPEHAVNKRFLYEKLDEVRASYLPLSGGQMTGSLVLVGDPTGPMQPVTKRMLDNLVIPTGNFLPLTGGTLTGPLVLSGDPTAPLQPVTKQMLDSYFATNIIGSPIQRTYVISTAGQDSFEWASFVRSPSLLASNFMMHVDGIFKEHNAEFTVTVAADKPTFHFPPVAAGKLLAFAYIQNLGNAREPVSAPVLSTGAPDLYAAIISSPSSVSPNQTFSVTIRFGNQGTAPFAGSTTVSFTPPLSKFSYVSQSASLTNGATVLTALAPVSNALVGLLGPLPVGAYVDFDVTLTASNSATSDTLTLNMSTAAGEVVLPNNQATAAITVNAGSDMVVTAYFHEHTALAAAASGMFRVYPGETAPGTVSGFKVVNTGSVARKFNLNAMVLSGLGFNDLDRIVNGGGAVIPPGARVWNSDGAYEFNSTDITNANNNDAPIGSQNIYKSPTDLQVELPAGATLKMWQYNNLPWADPYFDPGCTVTASIDTTPYFTDSNLLNNTDTVTRAAAAPVPSARFVPFAGSGQLSSVNLDLHEAMPYIDGSTPLPRILVNTSDPGYVQRRGEDTSNTYVDADLTTNNKSYGVRSRIKVLNPAPGATYTANVDFSSLAPVPETTSGTPVYTTQIAPDEFYLFATWQLVGEVYGDADVCSGPVVVTVYQDGTPIDTLTLSVSSAVPSFNVTKTVSHPTRAPGQSGSYTITVENSDTILPGSVRIADYGLTVPGVPAQNLILPEPFNCVYAGGASGPATVSINDLYLAEALFDIPPGGSVQITIPFTVSMAPPSPDFDNEVRVMVGTAFWTASAYLMIA